MYLSALYANVRKKVREGGGGGGRREREGGKKGFNQRREKGEKGNMNLLKVKNNHHLTARFCTSPFLSSSNFKSIWTTCE